MCVFLGDGRGQIDSGRPSSGAFGGFVDDEGGAEALSRGTIVNSTNYCS